MNRNKCPAFTTEGVHQWFSTGISARTSVVKYIYIWPWKGSYVIYDKVSWLKLFRVVKEKLPAKSYRGSNDTVFLHNKMVDDVNKCKMMHRRKTRHFICTVIQYYGLVISRELGVILDGSMKTWDQWQSSKWVQKSKRREGSLKQMKKMLLCYSLNPWCTHLLNHPLLLPQEG